MDVDQQREEHMLDALKGTSNGIDRVCKEIAQHSTDTCEALRAVANCACETLSTVAASVADVAGSIADQ